MTKVETAYRMFKLCAAPSWKACVAALVRYQSKVDAAAEAAASTSQGSGEGQGVPDDASPSHTTTQQQQQKTAEDGDVDMSDGLADVSNPGERMAALLTNYFEQRESAHRNHGTPRHKQDGDSGKDNEDGGSDCMQRLASVPLPFAPIIRVAGAIKSEAQVLMGQLLGDGAAKLAYDDDDANQDMFAMICTGRTLARIFHGINSPAFPAQFWSTSSHWKRYADYNFDHVLALCNRVAKKAKAHLVA